MPCVKPRKFCCTSSSFLSRLLSTYEPSERLMRFPKRELRCCWTLFTRNSSILTAWLIARLYCWSFKGSLKCWLDGCSSMRRTGYRGCTLSCLMRCSICRWARIKSSEPYSRIWKRPRFTAKKWDKNWRGSKGSTFRYKSKTLNSLVKSKMRSKKSMNSLKARFR